MSEFLAEASVLISPDLTAFRAKLIAELEQATRGVVATVGVAAKQATTAATAASASTVAAGQAAGSAAQRATTATNDLIRAEERRAAALQRIEAAERRVQAIESQVSIARTRASAAIQSSLIAEQGLAAARASGVREAILAGEESVRLAARREQEALANLNTARSERVLTTEREKGIAAAAGRQQFAARGALFQTAAQAGLGRAVISTNAAFLAGTVAAIGFASAVKSAANLESELNVFAVTTGATADQMARVGEEAQRLGADITLPGVAAGDAAEAFTELGKAGLSVEDSLAGARGVLQLATAAQIDNAQATVLAASALNAFGLAGQDAVHVADVLTNAANASQGSITDIGLALQQSAAAARLVGVSFEDTIALLTLLQKNGIRGSDAGTSLRVAFTRLINPTQKAKNILQDLNVQLRDARGNIRPEAFVEFARAQEGLSRSQQQANAAIVFGTDGLRAYSIIAREGIGSLNIVREQLDEQGSAAELAGARMAGLAGKAENLKNQLSAFGLTAGQVAIGPLGLLVDTLATTVNVLNTFGQGLAGAVGKFNDFVGDIRDATSVEIGGFEIGVTDFIGPMRTLRAGLRGVKELQDEIAQNNVAAAIIDTQVNVRELIADLNKVGGLTKLNDAVVRLQAFSAALAKGDERQKQISADIDVFIRKLQQVSTSPEIDPFELAIEIPPELLSGEPGRVLGEANKRAFLDALKFTGDETFGFQGFLSGVKGTAAQAASGTWESLRSAISKEQEKTRKAVTAGNQKLNVLQGQALDIQIEGGSAENQRLLDNLRKQEAEQRNILERRQELLKPGQVTSPAIRKAQQALDATLDQEKQIRGEMADAVKSAADDAKRKAAEIKSARDDADQAFLASLEPRRGRIDRNISRAAGTAGLQDDINQNRALKTRLERERELIADNVRDAKTAATEMARRTAELIGVGQTLTRLRQQKADAQRKIAEDRTAERTALLEGRVQLAEARGDKDAEVNAIDALIADVNKRIAKTKKATSAFVQLQIERQELLNKRKEILEQNEEAKGTTAFDLLRQASETFTANAGNLIGGNQPFAGPTSFTADLAQFLRRQQSTGTPVTTPSGGKGRLQIDDDLLIRALNRLTEATLGVTGNTSTLGGGVGGSSPVGSISRNDRRFYESRVIRSQVDADTGGGI